MPIKKRISKSKLRPNITVKGIDYKLKKDGAGFFMTDDVAEAFGRLSFPPKLVPRVLLKLS